MKKKRMMLLVLVTVFAFAGCAKEGTDTLGKGTEISVPGQEAENTDDKGNPTATPKPTATPVPTQTPEQIALASCLRRDFKDEVSARIVEKGYFYEMNQTAEDDRFRFDFKAITGDMKTPKLMLDVTVKDAALAEEYDVMKVFVYTLGLNAFDNEKESYLPAEGYGKRDDTERNLYHVTIEGTSAWMTVGDTFAVDVCGVSFEYIQENDMIFEYEVDTPEYRITVPQYEYHPVPEMGYDGFSYTYKGTEFMLERAEYGQYATNLRFVTVVSAETMKEYPGGSQQYADAFGPTWKEFLSTLTLELDGAEYPVANQNMMPFYEADNGDYKGAGYAEGKGIDFARVSEVILWAGTTGYDLKTGSKVPLSRPIPTPTPVPEVPQEQKDFAEQVRTLYKDDVSASLIEQGYYQTVNESFTDAIFRFDLKAVTGDKENRRMFFDVYVDDAVLAATYDKICLRVGCMQEEYYDPENAWAWNCTGYGYRNEEVGNLYHVALNGKMFGFAPTMVDIYQIGFDVDTDENNGIQWYDVNPEGCLVTVPEEVFHPTISMWYSEGDMVFTHEGKRFDLQQTIFGKYNTDLAFYTDIDAKEVPTDSTELWNYREEMQKDWLSFSATLRLVADGVEYPVIDEEGKRGYVWFDVTEGQESYRGNAHPYCPPVDYMEASEIQIKSGDTIYRLK